ncbi:TMhelix containing protein [Vibrio phage 1.215.B._10N.222.54.F7]|nr:TMhelix containing protein [Vibrio phage 1.215.A._10N.222.54.F7]AUR96101.1 TMhelix containing protein [Vibrio phage 1.215.B._10N.222.54.F7]
MAEQIVELVLRAKNEAQKAFTTLDKQVTQTSQTIDNLTKKTSANKQPRFFTNLSKVIASTFKEATRLTTQLAKVEVFKFNKVTAGIKKLGKELKNAREESEDLLDTFQEVSDVGDSLLAGSAAPALIATAGAASYASFSRSVSEVNTLLDGTVERQKLLESEVLAVSSAFGIDAAEVAQGYYQAISSGATDASNAVDFLTIAAKTSIGGVTDLATAVGGISTVVNSFGLEADEAGDAANALFVAVRAGRTTVGELSTSLADAAPLAAQLGIDFRELLSAVAAMTQTGTPTTQAITQIRAAMDSLISQKDVNILFQEMGYESSAAAIKAEGLSFALNAVKEATNGSESALIEMLGTQEAMGAVLTLTGSRADAFSDTMKDMVNDTGAVNRAFKAMEQTFGQKLQKTLTDIQNLFIVIGEALAPFASVLLSVVSDLVSALSDLIQAFPVASSVILGTITAVTLLATTIGLTLAVVGRLSTGFIVLGNLLKGTAAAFGIANVSAAGLIATLGRLALAISAIGAGFTVGVLIGDLIQIGLEIRRTREESERAQAELSMLKFAYPDANDMNIDAIRDYNDLTADQIELIREQQRQRLLINNAEMATLTTKREITKADYERIEALRLQNRIIVSNDDVLRESLAARNKDYLKYTDEQLKAEQDRLNTLIKGNRQLAQQSRIAANPDAVAALNQEYQLYITQLDRVLSQLKENGQLVDQVIDDLGLLSRGYSKSTEAAEDFRRAVESGLAADFSEAIAQIDLMQQGLTSAYNRGTIGAEDFLAANRQLVEDRLALERQYQLDMREQFERERAVREDNIRRFSTSEKQRQSDLRDLQRETEEFVIASHQREADAARNARAAAFQAYQQYADKVEQLEDKIASTERQREVAVRELRRKGFSELESYRDREREITELNGKIQREIDQGNFDLAEEYARRQISLAGQLASEVKENGSVVISEQEGIKRAIAGTEQGYDNLSIAQNAQAEEARLQAEMQLALYESLDSTLRQIQQTLLALATGSELVIDIDENTEAVNEAIAKYRQVLDKGAKFKINPEIDKESEEKTNQELAESKKKAEDQYGSLLVTTYAETGEFEQEVFTLTNGDQYAASVTVTANDGQYYAAVDELTAEGFIVEGKPTLIEGDLQQFYKDFEARIKSNPPRAEVALDERDSQENVDQGVEQLEAPVINTHVDADFAEARRELETFEAQANALNTSSLHTIRVDNSAVMAAKSANAKNTSSTHTVYVRQVEQRASGGLMGSAGFNRRRGYITGAGTTTSDSIPAMLSRSEYVHKASAVRKYGVGFMNAINHGQIPQELIDQLMRGGIPRFNTGGAVGVSESKSTVSRGLPTQDLNFNFPNGASAALQGTPDQVQLLIQQLRGDSRE